MTDTHTARITEWHRADGVKSILLYTLRHDGYRKGKPLEVNDVMIRIEQANGSTTPLEPIVATLTAALAKLPAEPSVKPLAWRVIPEDGEPYLTELKYLADQCEQDGEKVIPLYATPQAPAPQVPDGWQPMETAPKDGSKIDMWVHWAEGNSHSRVANAYWDKEENDWRLGQYLAGQFKYITTPTHWRPLPTPPSADTPQVPEIDRDEVRRVLEPFAKLCDAQPERFFLQLLVCPENDAQPHPNDWGGHLRAARALFERIGGRV